MMNLTEKLKFIQETLTQDLVERQDAIRLVLLAALSGEHLLLIGPPGTAKSLVARRLHRVVKGGSYFEHLLTRFTVPEELFGPLSIKALENDTYQRKIENYLPTASVAFLDEIFKANSAILNALLTLLNEREFDNGNQRIKTPIISVIGASNELPEGSDLMALYDRFLLRYVVGPVSDQGFSKLLELRGEIAPVLDDAYKISPQELEYIRQQAQQVILDQNVTSMLLELRRFAQEQQIDISDRRWRKIVKLLQVSAFTNGRDSVSIWDCWLLQHLAWNQPKQRELIYKWYTEKVGVTSEWNPARLTRLTATWEHQLKTNQDDREQIRNKDGELLYQTSDGSTTTQSQGEVPQIRGGKPLYLAPTNAVSSSSWHASPLPNQTNNGQGYTAEELNGLYFKDIYGNARRFQEWPELQDYLADQRNRFTRSATFAPAVQPRSFSQTEIDANAQDIDNVLEEIENWLKKLEEHQHSITTTLQTHLWIDPHFVTPATQSLKDLKNTVLLLKKRVEQVLIGFKKLPIRQHMEPSQNPQNVPSPSQKPVKK